MEKALDLREVRALSPYRAIVAGDGSGSESVAFADVAHQMLIYVRLPRHFWISGFAGGSSLFLYLFLSSPSSSPPSSGPCVFDIGNSFYFK